MYLPQKRIFLMDFYRFWTMENLTDYPSSRENVESTGSPLEKHRA